MKKFAYSALAVVFSIFLFASCNGGGGSSSNVEEDILGTWTITNVDLSNIDAMVDQMGLTGADLDDMKKEMKDDMQSKFANGSMTFSEDYTVNLSSVGDATWSYDADNNKIIITTPNDQKIDFIIEELKGDNLKAKFVITDPTMNMEIGLEFERE